jgi:hypothetical protein
MVIMVPDAMHDNGATTIGQIVSANSLLLEMFDELLMIRPVSMISMVLGTTRLNLSSDLSGQNY